ncbi:MAG: hypothetical protein HY335_09620 [Deinococcus sp.]|nr:hypothetical protein [Deinococcus sp.]
MGAEDSTSSNDFSDTPPGETSSFVLDHNLYWDGGEPILLDRAELINYTDDVKRVVSDPLLGNQRGLVVPRWDSVTGWFVDSSTTIRQAFERLVALYGTPANGSLVRDATDPAYAPAEDILGNPRPRRPCPRYRSLRVTSWARFAGWPPGVGDRPYDP